VPAQHPHETEKTCRSVGWPAADTVGAIALLSLAAVPCHQNYCDRTFYYVTGGITAASAAYGWLATGTCIAILRNEQQRAAAAAAQGRPDYAPASR
jgi:hypothetical protein